MELPVAACLAVADYSAADYSTAAVDLEDLVATRQHGSRRRNRKVAKFLAAVVCPTQSMDHRHRFNKPFHPFQQSCHKQQSRKASRRYQPFNRPRLFR